MRNLTKSFILSAFCSMSFFISLQEGHAATITAASCNYSDVLSAVNSAAVGDTVTVPGGSCTWGSTLSINKGISLIGAGSVNTLITGSNGLISYQPANGSTNALFRLSGFTFDFNGSSGMTIASGPTLILQTKVRIDNNRFQNASAQYLHYRGVRGVVDSNVFGKIGYAMRTEFESFGDGGRTEWDNFEGIVFGKADNNIWFEDNIFEGVSDAMTDCQVGNRYSFRYNTINLTAGTYSLFDMHGNQSSSFYSCFGGEIYGNNITGGQNGTLLDQRGGRVFVFDNNVTNSMGIQIREEYDDALSPVSYVGPNAPQMSQHVSGSYYWGNRLNMTGSLLNPYITTTCTTCIQNGLVAGVNFFADISNTSPGVDCGTLGARPTTCSPGQGYWATNQSCTNLTGMVGAHPATPIAGTLYRCTAANTWDSGASPLQYPHPLRGASVVVNPSLNPPSNLRII
ncbi:MAG: hypothetical protein ACXWRU_08365 [Pseudobdellovibrionaceae bacterium]